MIYSEDIIPPFKLAFLKKIMPLALEVEERFKIPAEVTIAQAIHESAWGASSLATIHQNYFGIKADKRWKGLTTASIGWEVIKGKRISEVMTWRKYLTLTESVLDYAKFLQQPRYKSAFSSTNWQDFLAEIIKKGYATNPYYVKDVSGIVSAYDLTRRLEPFRSHARLANSSGTSASGIFAGFLRLLGIGGKK